MPSKKRDHGELDEDDYGHEYDYDYEDSYQDNVNDQDWNSGRKDFIPAEQLPEADLHDRTCKDLLDLIKSGYVNLNPEYQRDVVWADDRKTALINSILEGYTVPMLLFTVERVRRSDGTIVNIRHCVDGKQRMTSIVRFMSGHLPCTDSRGFKWYYDDKLSESGKVLLKRRRILPDRWKKKFRNRTIPCQEYNDLSMEQQRELFARVQKGVALSPAEKMAATSGPYQSLAKEMMAKFPKTVALSKTDRSLDFLHCIHVFAQISEIGVFNETGSRSDAPIFRGKAAPMQIFLKANTNPGPNFSATAQEMFRIFATLERLRAEEPTLFTEDALKPRLKPRVFTGAEFVAIGVLIHLHKYDGSIPGRPFGVLSGDIRFLRNLLREQSCALRNHPDSWRNAWNYVENIEAYRGGVNTRPATKPVTKEKAIAQASPRAAKPTNSPEEDSASLMDIVIAKPLPKLSPISDKGFVQRRAAQNARQCIQDQLDPKWLSSQLESIASSQEEAEKLAEPSVQAKKGVTRKRFTPSNPPTPLVASKPFVSAETRMQGIHNGAYDVSSLFKGSDEEDEEDDSADEAQEKPTSIQLGPPPRVQSQINVNVPSMPRRKTLDLGDEIHKPKKFKLEF